MSDAAPPVPRRGRPGYDQATVLRRAIELFNQQGYDATSIGDLARELGITKSAIYHHVPSKEALLAAALDEALDGLSRAIDAALNEAAGTSAHERLRSAVRQSVEILGDHLPAVTLLLRVRGNSEVELAALKRRRVLDDKLAGLVQAAVDEGSLREDIAPELISRLLFGMVNSLVEWYRPDGPVPVEDLSAAIVDLAFEGLASGSAPGTIGRVPVDRLRPRNSAITVSSERRVTVTSYTPERPRNALSTATATSSSPRRRGLQEGDVEAGGDGHDAVGVAREGEGAVGERGDESAVAEVPAVDHVLADRHREGGGAGSDGLDHHAEHLRRGVSGPHRVGAPSGEFLRSGHAS